MEEIDEHMRMLRNLTKDVNELTVRTSVIELRLNNMDAQKKVESEEQRQGFAHMSALRSEMRQGFAQLVAMLMQQAEG